ncbi:MAG TPA: hypothetical protein VJ881_08485 [Halanaerobiales bacterium]|nr:hypothetical protein [Halanaerobiales bacterium]
MFKENEGFTLYLILISIIAASIFVLTLYNGAYVNVKLSKNLTYQNKAFYAAEAAIDYSKIILIDNNGIPLENKSGELYVNGEIYEKRNIYGNSSFQLKFYLLEGETDYYKVDIQGKHNKNVCKISVQYNEQFELINCKKI